MEDSNESLRVHDLLRMGQVEDMERRPQWHRRFSSISMGLGEDLLWKRKQPVVLRVLHNAVSKFGTNWDGSEYKKCPLKVANAISVFYADSVSREEVDHALLQNVRGYLLLTRSCLDGTVLLNRSTNLADLNQNMQNDLHKLWNWLCLNKVSLKKAKTK